MQEARLPFDRGGILNRLRIAALTAFSIHLLAGAAMALVLRHGLETNPNLDERLAFIFNQRGLWTAAWLSWTAAAIAILYFYAAFSSAHHLGGVAVLLTVVGVAADLSGQTIEIALLPGLAADRFIAFHRTAEMLSGFAGNGMYSLSAFLLAWNARRTYRVWLSSAGIATACFGFALSAAVFFNSVAGMFWTNLFLVPSILVWLAGVASCPSANPTGSAGTECG